MTCSGVRRPLQRHLIGCLRLRDESPTRDDPMSFALALAASASGFNVAVRSMCAHRSGVTTSMKFDWAKADIGSMVDMQDAPSGVSWARAAWAVAAEEMSEGGECYLIDESDGYAAVPDDGKDYYFCPTPATEGKMKCEELPEWMGTMPDGSAVYICTTPKMN